MRLGRTKATGRQRRPVVVADPSAGYNYSQAPRQPQAGPDKAQPAGEDLGSFWLQKTGLIVFLVAVTAAAVNVLSLAPSVRVDPLVNDSSRSFLRSTDDYAAAANNFLKGSVWNHTKLTADINGLQQDLLKQFPELTAASVTVPLLAHRPVVYVQPAQPALVLAAANGSFIIDDTGKALLNATDSSDLSKSLPTVEDQSGLMVKLKRQALPAQDVKFVQIVVAELAAKKLVVTQLTLPASSSELDAHIVGQPYLVKFNLQDNDARGQAGTFLATVTSLQRQHIAPAQYVDVRVSGRAYYQ